MQDLYEGSKDKEFYGLARVFLAKQGDQILGWSFAGDEQSEKRSPQPVHVYVREDMRKRGLGRKLVGLAVEYLKALRREPEVHQTNQRAKDFYTSVGLERNMVDW